jgi:hypothetical protein
VWVRGAALITFAEQVFATNRLLALVSGYLDLAKAGA